MNPQLERPGHPYEQLVAHFRDKIKAGELRDGERLPTVRDIAAQFGVAHTTAAKAMRALAAQGYAVTSNQGTHVVFGETSTYTPRDRLYAMGQTGRIYPPSERAEIISSDVVDAPDHVAEAMLIEPGAPVIRRERVTLHGDTPVTYSVSWLPGELADAVPELVSTDRIPGGTVGLIQERTSRRVDTARDTYRDCARGATAVEAARLHISPDTPVLYGQNIWPDTDGNVLEFGEYTIPPGRWVTVGP